jgi:hypothetical protein
MTDEFHASVALRRPRRGDLFMSPELRDLLEQAERAFRLAREMTNRADADRLEEVGRSLLERARRVAEEDGEPTKRVPK